MYTGTEIFSQAIAILDELSDSGTIVESQIKEYKHRAPYLLDLGVKELAGVGGLYYVEEYQLANEEQTYKWTKVALPSDFRNIRDVVFEDEDMQLPPVQYKQFGMTDLYIYYTQTGTLRLLYAPTPDKITALTQTLPIDESIATALAYYNAEHFALADQNDTLAARCKAKFDELVKKLALPVKPAPSSIIDVYNIAGIR